ncbi:MAG: hypothetical protein Q4G26_10090 [Paracoccus sp. (in: a-proteobacteria)]|nr:hypothetical protein [Paracoccus sp. (in: a-proteobacteria)]
MDAFTDRLSQRARDTTRPALAHQSLGRALSDAESGLAATMMAVMAAGGDFDAVVRKLGAEGAPAPVSGRVDWDLALLEAELRALNDGLDAAYHEHGYGA